MGGFPPRDLTLNWYRLLFADDAIWKSVLNSLLVALAAMAISLTFGIPAALALDRANFPGKALFRRLVLLPLILPGIITGLSLLMLFRAADVKLSLLTIILGHGTALISVATTEVFAGLQKLDRAQEEASLDLGANYLQTFWRVTLPNLRLSIIGAALLIFTLSMDEIAVSFFLIGRDNTLPLEIWGRLRRGITPEINAISTIIFIFSLAAIVTWYRLRGKRRAGPGFVVPGVPPRRFARSRRIRQSKGLFDLPPLIGKNARPELHKSKSRGGDRVLRLQLSIRERMADSSRRMTLARETTSLQKPKYIVKW